MSKLTPFGEASTGAVAAVFANLLVFPLDVVASRLQIQSKALASVQAHSKPYSSQLDALVRIAREEGLLQGLYAGLVPSLSQTAASAFLYFYFHSFVRGVYLKLLKRIYVNQPRMLLPSTSAELALGAVAGALSRAITNPISVVTTRLQTSNTTPNSASKPTSTSIINEILQTDGIVGLWRGFPASLVLTVNPALTYGLFERVKSLVVARRMKRAVGKGVDVKSVSGMLSSGDAFLVGALTKALATIVTYPYIMAKVRMQWRPPVSSDAGKDPLGEGNKRGLEDAIRYKSATDVLSKVWQTEGLLGWYVGLNAQLLKAVLCQGILFMTKDYFTAIALLLLK
ncbi:ADP/ATP carrier protein [Chytriomyces hyalinus]|nr:ADP/ATP carrier protein [Chytriomyces hyalinus]